MNRNFASVINEAKYPFYVFDICKLKKRIDFLKRHLPCEVSLCYAVKANPFVTKEIKEDLDRFEICSPGEANICTMLGIENHKMVISGIYKTPEVIESMVANSDFDGIITAESLQQYQLLCNLSQKYGRSLYVLLRLTNDSQFGMNESDIEMIVKERSENLNIHLLGIQFFSGTQKSSHKKYKREIEYLDGFLLGLKDNYGFQAEELEYGPGFPVAYFVSDEFDEEEMFCYFSGLLTNMICKPRITLELGRSIAASCGQYYTHIVDIKKNKGQNYALIDGGMHHIVYFGQYMAMKHPYISVVGKSEITSEATWTICGSLCSMNDIIAKQISLPSIEVGDTLCFKNTGAYCMTEGISLFLSRDLPSIYLMLENNDLICVRSVYQTEKINMPQYERML